MTTFSIAFYESYLVTTQPVPTLSSLTSDHQSTSSGIKDPQICYLVIWSSGSLILDPQASFNLFFSCPLILCYPLCPSSSSWLLLAAVAILHWTAAGFFHLFASPLDVNQNYPRYRKNDLKKNQRDHVLPVLTDPVRASFRSGTGSREVTTVVRVAIVEKRDKIQDCG